MQRQVSLLDFLRRCRCFAKLIGMLSSGALEYPSRWQLVSAWSLEPVQSLYMLNGWRTQHAAVLPHQFFSVNSKPACCRPKFDQRTLLLKSGSDSELKPTTGSL
jgi:hypothetical protein